MRLTIGVMGSSGGGMSQAALGLAYRLGEAIAERGAVLITGGCPGLPYEAVRGAKAKGGLVVGISPGLSRWEHEHKYRSPVEGGELAIAYDEGRLIGILKGTGGIAEIAETILEASDKETGACVLYEDEPTRLVDRLVEYYSAEHVKRPSVLWGAEGAG